ncbi:hypothetical protein K0F07_04460 [Parabacteroides merdae]|uniref:hypothetical protein n=1 Tax=Parabacteroides TaxID=375288 RepID=UPI001BA9A48C|nr:MULTISPECIES: hypothetical protein [Parabacteroides]MCE8886805.1 hypothetical protein [Parabacteroides merdae]QUT55018.1 hypothetical protein INE86_03560 [Parabacteroides distasonis]
MRKNLLKLFEGEFVWWHTLTGKEKLYVVYFLVSFTLMVGLTDGNSIGVMFLVILNFGNSVRLIKRVPIDKLEDY